MAMLNFRYGLFENLPSASNATQGTVFVTSDEQAMYIDLPKGENGTERIRIGDIIVKESSKTAQPPFAPGAFYYFIEDNALLRWDGKDWVQINSTKAVATELSTLRSDLAAEVKRATDAEALLLPKADFETFKTSNTALIGAAQTQADLGVTNAAAAQAAAEAADAKGVQGIADAENARKLAVAAQKTADGALKTAGGAMTGEIDMNSNKIVKVATPSEATDAANKNYVDTEVGKVNTALETLSGTVSAVSGKADQGIANAGTALEAANKAQKRADDAYTLAESKVTKQEIIDLDYATKAQAQAMADAVKGDADNDTSASKTVYGAIKGVEEAKAAAEVARALAAGKTDDTTVQNWVNSQGYATDTNARKYASDVKGTSNDDVSAETVWAAKKAAASAQQKADDAYFVASTANGTANTALTNAATAQTTAESAAAAAAAADAKGEQGISDAAAAQAAAEAADAKGAQGIVDAAAAQKVADDAAAQANTNKGEIATIKGDLVTINEDISDRVMIDGTSKMGGNLQMNSHKITGVSAPEVDTDAANKAYVDGKASALLGSADATSTTNATIYDVKRAAAEAQAKANSAHDLGAAALSRAGGEMTGDIDMDSHKIINVADPVNNGDAANKKYVDEGVADAKAYAEGLIASNDAMTFKGVLGNQSGQITALPSTANVGDTYKVGVAGTYSGIAAKVGDLIINAAEDDKDTPVWTHISSGYEDDYLQKLYADSTNKTIHLTNGVSNTATGSQGAIKFAAAAGTNLVFSVSDEPIGGVHTVTASMEWGTF